MALQSARSAGELSADGVGDADAADVAGAETFVEPALARTSPTTATTRAATAMTIATKASHENRGRCGVGCEGGGPHGCCGALIPPPCSGCI